MVLSRRLNRHAVQSRTMHTLIIGGNRFVGRLLARTLTQRGHSVTVFNRGTLPPVDGVEHVRGDRRDGFGPLAHRTFDAVADFACFTADDARGVRTTFEGRVGHGGYVMISTGQVYLVREGLEPPFTETDFPGPVMPAPPTAADTADWEYGVGKRAAEDALAGWNASVCLRIPIINGPWPLDYSRRLEGYLWRLRDGEPLLLPRATRATRHIWGPDLAHWLADSLEDGRLHPPTSAKARAVNLSNDTDVPLIEYVGMMRAAMGSKSPLIEVSPDQIESAGLEVRAVSPFSGRWASRLDCTTAKRDLRWKPSDVRDQLTHAAEAFLSTPPQDPPPGYASRTQELALARRSG